MCKAINENQDLAKLRKKRKSLFSSLFSKKKKRESQELKLLNDINENVDALIKDIEKLNYRFNVFYSVCDELKYLEDTNQIGYEKLTEMIKQTKNKLSICQTELLEQRIKDIKEYDELCKNLLFVVMGCANNEERQEAILKEIEIFRYSSYSMEMVRKIFEEMSKCSNYDQLMFQVDTLGKILNNFDNKVKA